MPLSVLLQSPDPVRTALRRDCELSIVRGATDADLAPHTILGFNLAINDADADGSFSGLTRVHGTLKASFADRLEDAI